MWGIFSVRILTTDFRIQEPLKHKSEITRSPYFCNALSSGGPFPSGHQKERSLFCSISTHCGTWKRFFLCSSCSGQKICPNSRFAFLGLILVPRSNSNNQKQKRNQNNNPQRTKSRTTHATNQRNQPTVKHNNRDDNNRKIIITRLILRRRRRRKKTDDKNNTTDKKKGKYE